VNTIRYTSGEIVEMSDVIRAESFDLDLQEGDHGISVCCMKKDGSIHEIGFVSDEMALNSPANARRAIEIIKWSGIRRE